MFFSSVGFPIWTLKGKNVATNVGGYSDMLVKPSPVNKFVKSACI